MLRQFLGIIAYKFNTTSWVILPCQEGFGLKSDREEKLYRIYTSANEQAQLRLDEQKHNINNSCFTLFFIWLFKYMSCYKNSQTTGNQFSLQRVQAGQQMRLNMKKRMGKEIKKYWSILELECNTFKSQLRYIKNTRYGQRWQCTKK